MDGACVIVYEPDKFLAAVKEVRASVVAATYGYAVQAPLYGLLRHALALDLPRSGRESFRGDVDVLFGLRRGHLGADSAAAATNLEGVENLDEARVAQGPELAEGIAGEREL
jgi:hypothetical protein